jgi:hypothetical protein
MRHRFEPTARGGVTSHVQCMDPVAACYLDALCEATTLPFDTTFRYRTTVTDTCFCCVPHLPELFRVDVLHIDLCDACVVPAHRPAFLHASQHRHDRVSCGAALPHWCHTRPLPWHSMSCRAPVVLATPGGPQAIDPSTSERCRTAVARACQGRPTCHAGVCQDAGSKCQLTSNLCCLAVGLHAQRCEDAGPHCCPLLYNF